MTNKKPSESLLFNTARQIENREERTRYLADACGDDAGLRERVEKLLIAIDAESQFLEQPAEGLEATVLLADQHPSVLRQLGNTMDEVPRILLAEPASAAADPIVKPTSPELPKSDPGGRYRLDGEIARGGMGAILKGRDIDLGRDLAIKVLLDAHKDNPQVIQRFIEEAQIGGQLQHPGIAPVYELGQFADQRPFFSMKLVKGETLSKLLADRGKPSSERGKFLGIFEQVCQTVAYAHSRNVIHRDLKPANIMVGAFGEVQVMDWGLAKVLSSGGVADERKARDSQQTMSIVQTMRSMGSDAPASFGPVGSAGSETQMGSVMGTPAYMPPEQALGEIDQLDQRSDVFGLGAILAEILTGKPPYVGEDGTQVFRLASRGKLEDCFARLDTCGADKELIQLTKACLALEPANRPKDAGIVAERVSHYQESVETKLRQAEVQRAAEAARVIEQKKRFRVILALAATIGLFLLSGGAFAWWRTEQLQAAALREIRNNDAISELLSRCRASLVAGEIQTATTALEDAKQRFDDGGAEQHTATLQSLEADLVLLKDLTNIDTFRWTPLPKTLLSEQSESFFPERTEIAQRIHAALIQFGIDLNAMSVEALRQRISQSSLQERITTALDLLILYEQSAPARLLLQDMDDDAFRTAVREAILTNDTAQITSMVTQSEALQQPANFIAILAQCELVDNEYRQQLSKNALNRTPNDLSLLMNLTELLESKSIGRPSEWNHLDEQLRWCQALVAAAPHYHLAHERLGATLEHTGKREEAIRCYERSIELNPDNPGAFYKLGHMTQYKDPARAIGCFRKAIEIDATYGSAISQLGLLLIENGEPEEGMRYLLEAVEHEPKWVAFLYFARGQESTGDTESAIDSYRMSIELFPEFPLAHYELGLILHQQGDFDGAMACYRKSIEIFPEYKEAHVNLGAILCDIEKDYEAATAWFRSALEIDPNFAIAHSNLAIALHLSGDSEGAIASLRRVTEINPENADAHLQLAYKFNDIGDFEAAVTVFDKVVELDPSNAVSHNGLGDALWNTGDWDGALASYRKALELDPQNAYAHNSVAWKLANKADAEGQFPQAEPAVAWARRATELEPDESAYQNTLGVALYRTGHWQEASVALLKSIELGEDGPYNWLFLAMVNWRLYQKDKAQEWYDKSLAWKLEHEDELQEDTELQGFFGEAAMLIDAMDDRASVPDKGSKSNSEAPAETTAGKDDPDE